MRRALTAAFLLALATLPSLACRRVIIAPRRAVVVAPAPVVVVRPAAVVVR